MTILDRILEAKRAEVAGLDHQAIAARLAAAPPVRAFAGALRSGERPAVIAEFKRASPSRGEIRHGAEPSAVAADYEAGGAAALSVLTDADFFSGSLNDLRAARDATGLPALRKDFIIDTAQLGEARAAGADAVLLIVAALADEQLRELLSVAGELGMDALVEVHDEAEAERALGVDAQLVGINNRDLRTFDTDPGTTRRLLPRLEGRIVVSESGLDDPDLIESLSGDGVDAFLIGEALMRATDPRRELERLRGRS